MTSLPHVTQLGRNAAIDLIRGASVLYIVGYWHLFNYTGAFPAYYNPVTLRLTVIILGLFVLISGYLIGAKGIRFGRNDILLFYKTRLLRIYAPFLVAAVLFYLLNIADISTLAKSAALLSMFVAPAPPTLWFIAMLLLFYIAAPFLIHLSTHVTRYVLACALLITAMLIGGAFLRSVDARLVIYCPAFVAGVLMARHKAWLSSMNIGVMALLLIASVVISTYNVAPVEHSFLSIPLALVGSLLVLAIAARSGGRIGQHRSITFLSYASFFMYLFHRPVFAVLLNLYFPTSGAPQIMYLLAICLPCIVAVSWLAQKAYDRLLSLAMLQTISQLTPK